MSLFVTFSRYLGRTSFSVHSQASGDALFPTEGSFPAPQARQMARRTQRNQRLRERQADALIYLEALLVRDPQLVDPVAAWFEPRVAARLEAAGLFHLDDLVDWVNERGQRWWVSVPRLGVKGAATVMFWLGRHAEVLEITLSARALTPRRQLDETAMHAELGFFAIRPRGMGAGATGGEPR